MVDQTDLDAFERGARGRRRRSSGSRRRPTRRSTWSTSRPSSQRAARRARRRRQHLRHAGRSSARSSSAPTPSCTRPPSTSAGTRTRSAARSSCATRELHERVRFVQNAVGAVPGPFDCFLVHRGLRTLHLRMRAHTENAPRGASSCCARADGVERRALARLRRDGGLPPPRRDADRRRTRIFSLAESLGGVESLIEVPQAMTHQSVEDSAAAVPADLVRLSCGIEAAEDLVGDLRQAIRALTPGRGAATPRPRPARSAAATAGCRSDLRRGGRGSSR